MQTERVMKEESMTTNHRFSLNEEGYVIDMLNPTNTRECYCGEGSSEDELYLRERVLWIRLCEVVRALIIEPKKKLPSGEEHQINEEVHSISRALLGAIEASHLNTLDPLLSTQHKFDGKLKREKTGMQDFTSLSLFVDDVERLLRDLYGVFDSQAIERVRRAVFAIVDEFTNHLRKDLWREHQDAETVDYNCGIGVPEGYGISGSDHRRAVKSANDLALRARTVRANPTSFSKYTVEFVKVLDEDWPRLGCSGNEIDRA
jgi:hypothetical protein